MEMLIAHATEMPEPPSQSRSDVPADLVAIVMRCLAKKPEDRFRTIADMEKALAGCCCVHDWTEEDAAAWWTGQGTCVDTADDDFVPTQTLSSVGKVGVP